VDIAEEQTERNRLQIRYENAMHSIQNRGCEATAAHFELACRRSVAVFKVTLQRLLRETATGTAIYETYYDLERLRLSTSPPGKYNWDKLRQHAEIEILGSSDHRDQLHYACLSIGGHGLAYYGECTVELRDGMIGHRASCFEGNSAVLYSRDPGFNNCIRSSWAEKEKLCVAALGHRLDIATEISEFQSILVENGLSGDDDRFIEVHVFGPMTCKTFSRVDIEEGNLTSEEQLLRKAILQKLKTENVKVD